MEHLIEPYVIGQSLWILLGIVAVTIFVLGKSADTMIDEAVTIAMDEPAGDVLSILHIPAEVPLPAPSHCKLLSLHQHGGIWFL